MSDRKVALYTATPNLYETLTVSLKSMMYYTAVDQVYLMVEDEGPILPADVMEWVRLIDVSNQRYFEKPTCPNYSSVFTYMALMRPLATKYLPEEDRVLTFDCDAFFKQPDDGIFGIDITDSYFAAAREIDALHFPTNPYYNGGVVLQNLKKIREDGIDDSLVRVLNWKRFDWPEQDVLNIICRGKITEMPAKYNANRATTLINPKDIIVRHYAGERPYQQHTVYQKFLCMPWSEVQQQHEINLKNSK